MERLKHKIWSPGYSSEWRSEDGVAYSAYNKFDIPETPFRMIFLSFLSFFIFYFSFFIFFFLFFFSSGATPVTRPANSLDVSRELVGVYTTAIFLKIYSWVTLRNNSWRVRRWSPLNVSRYSTIVSMESGSFISQGSFPRKDRDTNGYLTNTSNIQCL